MLSVLSQSEMEIFVLFFFRSFELLQPDNGILTLTDFQSAGPQKIRENVYIQFWPQCFTYGKSDQSTSNTIR